MNKVNLVFDKTLSNLAGYDYGRKIYDEQVRGQIDLYQDFTIEFPEQIRGVASSFVQGFFANIVETIGLLATEERANIISGNSRVQNNILKKLQ